MLKNQAKEKILNGDTAYGVFCPLYSPTIVELIGHLGFDFVLLDAEHSPIAPESCEHMVRAADSVGLSSYIRVAMNIRQNILRYLDTGASGVQLPMINSKAEAEAVVEAVKYRPQGKRGLAGMRADGYGLTMPLSEYTLRANQETLVSIQIETMEAINNTDELLTVDGVDIFFIGPVDLSCAMGYTGQTNHPEVQAMIERLAKKIQAAGKVAGTVAYNHEALIKAKERGFRYIVHNIAPMLTKSAKEYLELAHKP